MGSWREGIAAIRRGCPCYRKRSISRGAASRAGRMGLVSFVKRTHFQLSLMTGSYMVTPWEQALVHSFVITVLTVVASLKCWVTAKARNWCAGATPAASTHGALRRRLSLEAEPWQNEQEWQQEWEDHPGDREAASARHRQHREG
eukprot:TRINITY_DN2937_c0_g1_i2.p1 TRINITY_DN2937_c0_g1~~TRINITY_DN2937_c0_g1_i2.p1  ORF type:complete len:145 (+),score=5.71 TRINITY_DN2937_c0_g1_i2:74-508(+)